MICHSSKHNSLLLRRNDRSKDDCIYKKKKKINLIFALPVMTLSYDAVCASLNLFRSSTKETKSAGVTCTSIHHQPFAAVATVAKLNKLIKLK